MKGIRVIVLIIVTLTNQSLTKKTEDVSEFIGMTPVEKMLLSKINTLSGKLAAFENKHGDSDFPAFHAEGSQVDIHRGSIIKFGNVKTNIQGNYNPTSSIFTCTDRGLYLFYVTVSAYYDGNKYNQVWYQIVQDGHVRASGVTGHGSQGPVSTHFAMIRCYPGNHIWVRQGAAMRSWKQGMWPGHSQFEGFQIAK